MDASDVSTLPCWETGLVADYDAFAREFDKHAQDSAYNAHYDRPAVLELLGDIQGLSVLDAGCGSGLYVHELVTRGAQVTGVDASEQLVELAQQRLGDLADVRVHDLNEPLTWASDQAFDRIVMALVVHHLPDPRACLREMHRVMADDGRLVVSTVHPTSDWLRLGGSYFLEEMVEERWNTGWLVHFRRSPLERIVRDFTESGFVVDGLVEPRPAPSMAGAFPTVHDRLSREPGFIAFRLRK